MYNTMSWLLNMYLQVYRNTPLSDSSILYIQVQQLYLVLSNLSILSTLWFSFSYSMILKNWFLRFLSMKLQVLLGVTLCHDEDSWWTFKPGCCPPLFCFAHFLMYIIFWEILIICTRLVASAIKLFLRLLFLWMFLNYGFSFSHVKIND